MQSDNGQFHMGNFTWGISYLATKLAKFELKVAKLGI